MLLTINRKIQVKEKQQSATVLSNSSGEIHFLPLYSTILFSPFFFFFALMSDSNERVILPIPYLIETASSSTPRKNGSQTLSFGNSQFTNQTSFEDYNFPPHMPSLPPMIEKKPIATKGKRLTTTRYYQTYKGKTVFFCGGRFLASRSFWAFCLSLFLVIAPSILFFIFT